MKTNYEYVLNMTQLMVDREKGENAITRDLITTQLEKVFNMEPSLRSLISIHAVVKEMERRFNV